jgi:hypothetical protein
MRRRLAALLPLVTLAAALAAFAPSATSGATVHVPQGFYGVVPQTSVTERDGEYMRAGGIESIRLTIPWFEIQPTEKGGYNWAGIDGAVASAARAGIRIFPFLYGTPKWLASKPTTLPIDNARQKQAWKAFLRAVIARYGPRGEFWTEHATEGINYEPAITKPLPIRTWQVWNEANFFYFDYPVSPTRYAKLLKLSYPVIKSADRGAKVILTGLFGRPDERLPRGMPAADFLKAFYRVPGIKSKFDGVALHPYAFHVDDLEELVEELHEVVVENHDHPSFYLTEIGWGSQNDPNIVAFEQGIQGQARELRGAYSYLLDNQRRLNLKGVYWFSWKDIKGGCTFCDSVGFFKEGDAFKPKPAWRAFVKITGGRVRP